MEELTLRKCEEQDLRFVHDLLRKNMRKLMLKHWGKWNSRLFWEKARKESITIVEYRGQRIAFFDVVDEGNSLHLLNIDVARKFQNGGIGTYLLSLLDQQAEETGAAKITLEVFPDNRSVALYARCGYETVGKENQCLLMEKRRQADQILLTDKEP